MKDIPLYYSETHFTRLVVEAYHLLSLHGEVQLILVIVCQRYWISRGQVVKR